MRWVDVRQRQEKFTCWFFSFSPCLPLFLAATSNSSSQYSIRPAFRFQFFNLSSLMRMWMPVAIPTIFVVVKSPLKDKEWLGQSPVWEEIQAGRPRQCRTGCSSKLWPDKATTILCLHLRLPGRSASFHSCLWSFWQLCLAGKSGNSLLLSDVYNLPRYVGKTPVGGPGHAGKWIRAKFKTLKDLFVQQHLLSV